MKRKEKIAIAIAILLIGGVWIDRAHRAASLPRFVLAADAEGEFPGGEFRVFKICYGGLEDQRLGGASGWRFRLWDRLPASLKKVIPYPERGVDGESILPPHKALSVWFGVVDPNTHQSEFGPCGEVTMTTDGGEDTNLRGPYPGNPGYRQIMVIDPPRDSRKLHFIVPVENQTVEFTIANPAYRR